MITFELNVSFFSMMYFAYLIQRCFPTASWVFSVCGYVGEGNWGWFIVCGDHRTTLGQFLRVSSFLPTC